MLNITWMNKDHVPAVLDIEQQSFDVPWTETDFRAVRLNHDCVSKVVINNVVAGTLGQRVVGYMIYELHDQHIHIINLAVHPSFRRRGIAQKLLLDSTLAFVSSGRDTITANVRESNLPAQLFFKACGFVCTDIEKCLYLDTLEDAYHMEFTCHNAVEA